MARNLGNWVGCDAFLRMGILPGHDERKRMKPVDERGPPVGDRWHWTYLSDRGKDGSGGQCGSWASLLRTGSQGERWEWVDQAVGLVAGPERGKVCWAKRGKKWGGTVAPAGPREEAFGPKPRRSGLSPFYFLFSFFF